MDTCLLSTTKLFEAIDWTGMSRGVVEPWGAFYKIFSAACCKLTRACGKFKACLGKGGLAPGPPKT